MLTKIYSAAISGIDAFPVTIETEIWKGAGFTIVGMADTSIRESYERMLSAIRHSGYEFPHHRISINLAPADIKKEGAQFDLPMAIGILTSAEFVRPADLSSSMLTGELSLDGSVLPVKGVLPMAIKAREMGLKRLIVPEGNVTEAAVVNKIDVYGVKTLQEAVAILEGSSDLSPVRIDTRALFLASQEEFDYDFSEVKGQESVKRAFEIGCAGGHNLIMVGPPGAGKSMMAKRLPSIMPPLSMAEALETTKIHSVAGKLSRGSMLMTKRPFRTPHRQTTNSIHCKRKMEKSSRTCFLYFALMKRLAA